MLNFEVDDKDEDGVPTTYAISRYRALQKQIQQFAEEPLLFQVHTSRETKTIPIYFSTRAAGLEINVAELNFGKQLLNIPMFRSFTITNKAPYPLLFDTEYPGTHKQQYMMDTMLAFKSSHVKEMKLLYPVTTTPKRKVLQPKEKCQVTAKLESNTKCSFSADKDFLTIETLFENYHIPVEGMVVPFYFETPEPPEFGEIFINTMKTGSITLQNESFLQVQIDMKIRELTESEDGLVPFSIQGYETATLKPREKRIVKIYFCPRVDQLYKAELVITVDIGAIKVPLTGIGVTPDIRVPRQLNFGIVPFFIRKTLTFKMVNNSYLESVLRITSTNNNFRTRANKIVLQPKSTIKIDVNYGRLAESKWTSPEDVDEGKLIIKLDASQTKEPLRHIKIFGKSMLAVPVFQGKLNLGVTPKGVAQVGSFSILAPNDAKYILVPEVPRKCVLHLETTRFTLTAKTKKIIRFTLKVNATGPIKVIINVILADSNPEISWPLELKAYGDAIVLSHHLLKLLDQEAPLGVQELWPNVHVEHVTAFVELPPEISMIALVQLVEPDVTTQQPPEYIPLPWPSLFPEPPLEPSEKGSKKGRQRSTERLKWTEMDQRLLFTQGVSAMRRTREVFIPKYLALNATNN